ncbi:hypothetical protein RB620_20250 [Paenibacillus sp. LHD-117]|uniref:hypothetical protein n=1 Tax=Paenibacillus sp. LHD-117 TaxID=3071412 RepID=UPI0027E016BA|nr:hypothetical protein [Paenibacillus sp. LHD-117]MDQ6421762.1 hypothetical protein [Paenibacillus sp. LHD-117]
MHLRGVILEGYSNAGKTSVLKAIKRYQALDETAERSVVVLGEHYSQVLNNVHGQFISLTPEEHLKLLRDRVDMLKNLDSWAAHLGPASRSSRGLFFVLERFHLNHRAAFPDEKSAEISLIEQDLLAMGARCVLLTISDEVVEERVKSRQPAEWACKSREEIERSCNQLIHSQLEYRFQAERSIIPTLEINTDAKDWDEYARLIMAGS